MSETKMARASLKKTVAYATELLNMIGKDDDIEGWVQAKITEMDHNIEAVYSYYKFCEDDEEEEETEEENSESGESEKEESEENDSEEIVFNMDIPLPRP